MSKRKYRKGGKITSLDELAKQEFVYFHDKITHWMPLPEAPKMKGGAE